MKRRSFLSLIPAAVYLAGCAKKPFYFIQMADTQLGMIEGGDDKTGDSFTQETEIIKTVIARINAMTPAPEFVVVCGDLTNLPEHEKQIAEYKRLMHLLKPSILHFNVSGNHDFKGNPTPDSIAFYRAAFGSDFYSYDVKGSHFIVLNSTLMKFPGGAEAEAAKQLAWLKDDLAAHRDGAVVFMHHPFFDNDIDEDDGYHSITKADRGMWLDMFADSNVAAVFSGHRHTTIPEHDYRGVKLINTNAICNSFDNKPGLRVVGELEEGLVQRFYLRDEIPAEM